MSNSLPKYSKILSQHPQTHPTSCLFDRHILKFIWSFGLLLSLFLTMFWIYNYITPLLQWCTGGPWTIPPVIFSTFSYTSLQYLSFCVLFPILQIPANIYTYLYYFAFYVMTYLYHIVLIFLITVNEHFFPVPID